ncbi:MAG: phosphomethylpyrimidine kinase [Methanomicrobiales archaeon]|nr:phosphomethylpyrimidine kinase [Methanomicrobiales archaeon]
MKQSGDDRAMALARLSDALRGTEVSSLPAALVPAGGIELAYALSRAVLPEDVATVVLAAQRPATPVFGVPNEAVRCLLTARRFDARIRATGVILNSIASEAVLDALLLQVCSYDRAREPAGISSMHWGVAGCCREGVPDAVVDRGAKGAEGLIRLFSEDPAGIARMISAIGSHLHAG